MKALQTLFTGFDPSLEDKMQTIQTVWWWKAASANRTNCPPQENRGNPRRSGEPDIGLLYWKPKKNKC